MRKRHFHKIVHWMMATIMVVAVSSPAAAISIKEEEQLAREFLKVVARRFDLVEDPLIVGYVDQVGRKILAQIPSQPFNFHFYVIKEDVYNAFAVPAGHIFVNSGLLAAMESEDELAGILAHEIAHVVCRHISQRIERSKKIDLATLAGVVAGVFLGAVSGDPAAMQAVTIGSTAAGQTATLAYSREDEGQADQLGQTYLSKAGFNLEGLLHVLKKIRGKQWFGTQQIPSYMMTHPAVEERIARIDTNIAIEKSSKKPQPEKTESSALFKKVTVRLKALYDDPNSALQHFENALARQPAEPNVIYGYGLALARLGQRDKAVRYLKKALAQEALDPVILSDLGRVYFLDGRYEEALNTLEGAASLTDKNAEGLFYLGRTYMELGKRRAAIDAFEKLLEVYNDYRPAYQFLGETYGRLGRMPEAHFYLGIFHFKKGDFRTAYYHLMRAKKSIQEPSKLDAIQKALDIMGKPPEERRPS